jgi:dTMP kinase
MWKSTGVESSNRSGRFIVFEGPEGGGKTLQVRTLADRLRLTGVEVAETREPGGTRVGDSLRTLLLGLGEGDYAILPETEVLMLAAARAQHVREVIAPALARGAWVICDRYVDSTYAYQGGGHGIDLHQLEPIQRYATGGLEPDLRVLLDVPVEVGLARRHADPASINRIDLAAIDFHQRVRTMYQQLAAASPQSWLVIDAEQAPDTIANQIWQGVQATELIA